MAKVNFVCPKNRKWLYLNGWWTTWIAVRESRWRAWPFQIIFYLYTQAHTDVTATPLPCEKQRKRERETVEMMAMRMNVNRLRMIATAQNDTQSDAWRYDSFKRYFWNGLHISWLQLLIRINCAEHLFFIFDCKTATKWDNTRIYWYGAHTHIPFGPFSSEIAANRNVLARLQS